MDNRLYLRAFEYSDLDVLNKLRNDEEAYQFTGGNKYYISKEYDRKWIEDKIFNNQKQIYLAICLNNTNEVIGYLCIIEIDHWNRKAIWGGINIDLNYGNKGFATEASLLMLRFAFEELGINRFWGYWLESNIASLRMAEKLGFIKEGLVADFVYKKNCYHNAFILRMLHSEYDQLYNSIR